jgi:hypothetical protein
MNEEKFEFKINIPSTFVINYHEICGGLDVVENPQSTFKATGVSIIDALNKLNEEMFRYNKHYIIDSFYEMQQ